MSHIKVRAKVRLFHEHIRNAGDEFVVPKHVFSKETMESLEPEPPVVGETANGEETNEGADVDPGGDADKE